jgi:hypothetical protein
MATVHSMPARKRLETAALAALLAAGPAAWAQVTDAPWVGEARGVATSVPPKLLTVLQAEIAKGGPEGAIGACRDQAPQMARTASEQSGWAIRRVSLRNRNPKAVPDAWERAALEDFDRRTAAGEPPATLERAEVVTHEGQRIARYIRALPTQELCTHCHGLPERLSPAVSAKLKELYPADLAVGYKPGEIRGAITLRKPVP